MLVNPSVLILSSRFDFSCDYITSRLRSTGTKYLRLNSEDLPTHRLRLDPIEQELECMMSDRRYVVSNDQLRSVWFRRSVYLREFPDARNLGVEAQIARTQWAAFMRGLAVFDRAKWVNPIANTYLAEQKPLQLLRASQAGFCIPRTVVSNDAASAGCLSTQRIALKGTDTVIANLCDKEVFGFTTFISLADLEREDLSLLPVTVQEEIEPKLDIRVTVVEERVFAVSIGRSGQGVTGDWRTNKAGLEYQVHHLPASVEQSCKCLTNDLGLHFAAIDLALRNGEYYFLEVNPTGEWAWLVEGAGVEIDKAITDALVA